MGIELPAELAGIAEQTGLQWPKADEDKLRDQASAWRDAQGKLQTLASDADRTAGAATQAMSGPSADAARTMWSGYVDPDSGHLTGAAKGAGEAADRLDHAADQVGAAKVEMVRQLVDASKNQDAANAAASAGHPTALLGLDSVLKGTSANLSTLTQGLASSVGGGGGGAPQLLDVNPGAHSAHGQAGLLSAVTGVPANLVSTVDNTTGGVVHGVTDTAGHTVDAVGQTAGHTVDAVGHTAGQTVDAVGHTAGHTVDALGHTAGHTVDAVGHPAHDTVGAVDAVGDTGNRLVGGGPAGDFRPPVGTPEPNLGVPHPPDLATPPTGQPPVRLPGPADVPAPGQPGPALPPATPDTGPIQTGQYGGFLASRGFDDVPTPPSGVAAQHVPGATSAAGFIDAAPPSAAAVPGAPPQQGYYAPPPQPQPAAPQVDVTAQPPQPGPPVGRPPVAPPIGGVVAGPAAGAPATAQPARGPQQPPAAPPVVPPRGAQQPAAARRMNAPAPRDVSPDAPTPPSGRKYPQQQPPLGALPKERESVIALFMVHMFPIGHLPVATVRPARQLPVPPEEVDFAPGLRFPPHDHPESAAIDTGEALDRVREGFSRSPSPAQEPPAGLTEGYDELGGLHERDFDRRFVAGTRDEIPEYAWPPGELYPEGGFEDGEPQIVPEGTLLDRFGPVDGRVFAPEGTLFAKRSLPPATLRSEYRRYRVVREMPMWQAVSAPWFGQPGGGVRYRAVYSADELVTMGYLALEEAE